MSLPEQPSHDGLKENNEKEHQSSAESDTVKHDKREPLFPCGLDLSKLFRIRFKSQYLLDLKNIRVVRVNVGSELFHMLNEARKAINNPEDYPPLDTDSEWVKITGFTYVRLEEVKGIDRRLFANND